MTEHEKYERRKQNRWIICGMLMTEGQKKSREAQKKVQKK